jgi:large subunit ribosomal protein L21
MAEKKASKTTKKAPKETANVFAVIATGGKQYQVSEGEVISIEKMTGDFKIGDKVVFDQVLMVDDGASATIGTPYIKEANIINGISFMNLHELVKFKKALGREKDLVDVGLVEEYWKKVK